MKGFGGILLLLAIILASGILLMSNMQTKQDYSFKELIPQTKTQLTNFEITLKQMTQGCDFTDATLAKICIDGNASNLFNAQQLTGKCTYTVASQIGSTQKYQLNLFCKKSVAIGANAITIDTNRLIIIEKY